MKEIQESSASPNLPSLTALRAFETVVRTGSVTAAARELGVTQGAVSHQTTQLEAWFGIALLRREGRGLRPTDAGQNLSEHLAGAFALLEEGCARLRRAPRGELRVAAPASFLGNWLVPRLESFERAGTRLVLRTDGAFSDLRAGRTDALVVCGTAPWPADLRIVEFAPERIGPVCAPSLERHRNEASWPPAAARLETLSRPEAWKEWSRAAGQKLPRGAIRHFDHLGPLLEAARAGLGFAVAPELLVERELRRGELVAPLGFVPGSRRFALAVLASRADEPALRDLAAWFADPPSA